MKHRIRFLRRRREFISLVGVTALSPLMALAQQRKPIIGHVHAGVAAANRNEVIAFEQGLKQRGYATGQSVQIQYLWAEGRYDQLPALVSELLDNHVNLIVAGTPVAALAAKRATASIPIVFHVGSDPVKDGLVASLSRPGGNITGTTFFSNLLISKRLGLLVEMIPSINAIVALVNPYNANAQFQSSEAVEASRALGLKVHFVKVATGGEIDRAFEDMRQDLPDALLILSDTFLNSRAAQISALAIRSGLPTCFAFREPALAGGLIGYGASRSDNALRAGDYAGRILNGEKPADLPVLQPTRFDFVINLNTAKALGLTVPPTLLARADEVIE